MGQIVIAPEGQDAIQVGTLIDDAGERFVAIVFQRPGEDPVLVSFTPELFRAFAGHLGDVATKTLDPQWWRDHPA